MSNRENLGENEAKAKTEEEEEDCVNRREARGKRLLAIPAASSCANSGQIVISRNKLNINAA